MLRELGYDSSSLSVARHYADVLNMFAIDTVDAGQVSQLKHGACAYW